tara:strand:+ start:5275 stop:5697 length:423 start_codon:yes stop_codon:yes gene_type:complete
MKVYFNIEELVITGETPPANVEKKLWKHHINPMNKVREELGLWITASQHSGYRPVSWELSHGRSGKSQHTFTGKGAVDWTCEDFPTNKDKLLELIIKHTNYTRMALYNGFIHCDHKSTSDGKRQLFNSNSASKWTFVKNV